MDYQTLTSEQLIEECARNSSPLAWKEFVRRFEPLISGVVARTARQWTKTSASLVDDLVQETYLKLCTEEFRRLREFQTLYEDGVYGYLKTIAYRVTVDYFKAQKAMKRGGQALSDADFETVIRTTASETDIEDTILLREMEDLVNTVAVSDRDRLIFQYYYRQGFTAKAIAQLPGINLTEKGVESSLHRMTEQLRQYVAGVVKE